MTVAEEAEVDDRDCPQHEDKLEDPASSESLDVFETRMLLRLLFRAP